MSDATAGGTVLRTWRGRIRTADRDAYRAYLEETGLAGYRATPGNRGAWVMFRDLGDGLSEVVTASLWTSLEVVRGFAGDDVERAVFYPEDDRYLVERDLVVTHFEVG